MRRSFAAATAILGLAAASALATATITKRQARAIVAAIELRHSDLPGTSVQADPVTAQEQQENTQLARCMGSVLPSAALAFAQSPSFNSSVGGGQTSVNSATDVLPSVALVAKDFAADAQPRALSCLTRNVVDALEPGLPTGERILSSATVRIAAKIRGFSDVQATRTTITVSPPGGGAPTVAAASSTSLHLDLIAFADGQVEIELQVVSTPGLPSSSLEQRLDGILGARARTVLGK